MVFLDSIICLQEKTVNVEKIKTHFIFNSFFSKNRVVYETMWKKYRIARQATDGNIIRRMRFACWITKATNTHSEYVTLTALPLQQWLRERASMLRYTHIACVVNLNFRGRYVPSFKLSSLYLRQRISGTHCMEWVGGGGCAQN
jgi:hypothetical protein